MSYVGQIGTMKTEPATRLKSAFLWFGIGAVTISAALFTSIVRSTLSTAVIGILFIPFNAASLSLPFFIFGYCLPDLIKWIKGKSAELSMSEKFHASIALVTATFGITYIVYGSIFTLTVNNVRTINEPGIDKFLESSIFRSNKFALGALAQNQNVSAGVLDKIARLQWPELHDKMWSVWPVMDGNGKGLAVMRLVVRNSNVSEKAIEYLARTSQNEYVLSDIAANPKTSTETLRSLEAKKNYLIDWGLSQNPKSPPDVFSKLLDREKYFTQRTTLDLLLRNPSIPSEVRIKASVLLNEY